MVQRANANLNTNMNINVNANATGANINASTAPSTIAAREPDATEPLLFFQRKLKEETRQSVSRLCLLKLPRAEPTGDYLSNCLTDRI